jgi:hypothetical protein
MISAVHPPLNCTTASLILGFCGLKISFAEIYIPKSFISLSFSSVGIHIPPYCCANAIAAGKRNTDKSIFFVIIKNFARIYEEK